MKRNIIAISLIECLLSLAVIASISLMAVRYYMITTRDMRVSSAISQVKRLTNASYEWLQAQKQADFSGEGGGTAISLNELTRDQLVDPKVDTLNPWGGSITVAAGSDASYVKISLQNLPPLACKNLTQQLRYMNRDNSGNACASKKNNTFTGVF